MPNFTIGNDKADAPSHNNKITPRWKFNWVVSISHGTTSLWRDIFVQKISRPSAKVEVEEVWGLNDVLYIPGKRSYTPLEITFVEFENISEFKGLFNLFASMHGGYDDKKPTPQSVQKDLTITATHIGSDSNKNVTYTFQNCFIYDIKPDEFAYDSNDFSKFSISVRFDNYKVE